MVFIYRSEYSILSNTSRIRYSAIVLSQHIIGAWALHPGSITLIAAIFLRVIASPFFGMVQLGSIPVLLQIFSTLDREGARISHDGVEILAPSWKLGYQCNIGTLSKQKNPPLALEIRGGILVLGWKSTRIWYLAPTLTMVAICYVTCVILRWHYTMFHVQYYTTVCMY